MNLRLLIKILGAFSLSLGWVFFVPALYSAIGTGTLTILFLLVGLTCTLTGGILYLSQKDYQADPDHKTTIAGVVVCSVAACLAGSVPYYMSGAVADFHDALFESVSGFTATGASVLLKVELADRSILLWRSMTQWLGGLGILLFFVGLSPVMMLSGSTLLQQEGSVMQK